MSKKSKKKTAKRHLKSVKVKSKPRPAKRAKPASKPAPSTAARARCVEILTFARRTINKFFGGIPDDKLTAQAPGLPNHALWTQGHLACTAAWALSLITGEKDAVPEHYNGLFGMNSSPADDPGRYPPAVEVRGYFDSTFDKLVAAASKLNDAALDQPVEAGGFAKDKGELLTRCAWHEGWHLGQIADLRRALGLPPAMG
jgi:hypothetical protein